MNALYIGLYEDEMVKAMEKFSGMPFVQKAIEIGDSKVLTEQAEILTDHYIDFFQKLELLPKDMQTYKHSLEGDYNLFVELSKKDDPVFRLALGFLPQKKLSEVKSAIPIHFSFSDSIDFHMVSGLAWVTREQTIRVYLSGCILPKDCTKTLPDFLSNRPD